MRILLIEDDPMIGEGLSRALKAEAMTVDWVSDGPEAEAALRDGAHSVVLLDLGLPGTDGLDLLKAARRDGLKTPILVITARDGLGDRVSGLDLGAVDFLVKPFEIQELLARECGPSFVAGRGGRSRASLRAQPSLIRRLTNCPARGPSKSCPRGNTGLCTP